LCRSVNLRNLLYHRIFPQRLRTSSRRLLTSTIQLVQALVSCFSTLGLPSRSTQDFRARMQRSSLFQLSRFRHDTPLSFSLYSDVYLTLLALPYTHTCTLLQCILLYQWVRARFIYAIHVPLRVCASYRSLLSYRDPSLELGSAGSGRVLPLMLALLTEGAW
jgi:hypothetical protein